MVKVTQFIGNINQTFGKNHQMVGKNHQNGWSNSPKYLVNFTKRNLPNYLVTGTKSFGDPIFTKLFGDGHQTFGEFYQTFFTVYHWYWQQLRQCMGCVDNSPDLHRRKRPSSQELHFSFLSTAPAEWTTFQTVQ